MKPRYLLLFVISILNSIGFYLGQRLTDSSLFGVSAGLTVAFVVFNALTGEDE